MVTTFLRRTLLSCAIGMSLVGAALAATASFAVTNAAWVDLGTTPCFIQNISSHPIRFIIDTSAPVSSDLTSAHILNGVFATNGVHADNTADIGLSGEHVYARVESDPATVIVSR